MVTHEMMETAVREHMREAVRAQRQREARTSPRWRRDARPRGVPSQPRSRCPVWSLLARLSVLASVW
jgi:hypothetical protein